MAVYTTISQEDLQALLASYEIGHALDLKPIQEGVENSNFSLTTTLGRFILTIYEKRVEADDLPFFLGLMQHLAERGLPCPLPVRGLNESMLQSVRDKPVAIVTFLAGVSARRITTAHCRVLGEALASLHLAAQGFGMRRANALNLAGWIDVHRRCGIRADEVVVGLSTEIENELRLLAEHWPRDLPRGVIHADLFPDNVFFSGGHVSGLIDFYFACDDLLVYDLAICLNAWCFESDGSFNVTKAKSLVEGYKLKRGLSALEIRALPILARGAALRFLVTRLYDWLHRIDGALVKPKDPREYLTKLRFHRDIEGPAAYGL